MSKLQNYDCFMVKTELKNLTKAQLVKKNFGVYVHCSDKFFFSSESTLHIFFKNITGFYLLLLASKLEKVFVWIGSNNLQY